MTKKEMIIDVVELVGAKLVDGIYEMTLEQYDRLSDELDVSANDNDFTYSLCKNKKDETKRAIYDGNKKNRYCIIKLVEEKAEKKAEKKEKKTVVRTGATVKVYGEKKEDSRSFKVIEVNNTKVHHYEAWLSFEGKRKKVGSSENKDVLIKMIQQNGLIFSE